MEITHTKRNKKGQDKYKIRTIYVHNLRYKNQCIEQIKFQLSAWQKKKKKKEEKRKKEANKQPNPPTKEPSTHPPTHPPTTKPIQPKPTQPTKRKTPPTKSNQTKPKLPLSPTYLPQSVYKYPLNADTISFIG